MIAKENLKKITDYLWEIPSSFRSDMKVGARIYASEKLLPDILKDNSLNQLINVATLQGLQKYAIAMPDIHEGYGMPIGGVAAFDLDEGIISPGQNGYDINCGIRLLKTNSNIRDWQTDSIQKFIKTIYRNVPSGLGEGGGIVLDSKTLDKVLEGGVKFWISQGYGENDDIKYCESEGSLQETNASCVSDLAKRRGKDQLGTLGAGNHFMEIQKVTDIFDEEIAKVLGLALGDVAILIHSGSRGLGHQIATDYIKLMMKDIDKYHLYFPDQELIGAPFYSEAGKQYYQAMNCAANFAWVNRQTITYLVRKSWKECFGNNFGKIELIYDLAHNIAKLEEYKIDGNIKKVLVHRKGATRAFAPKNPEIPEKYRQIGQPVIIPGSMGTASFIMVGTEKAMEESFGSCCHGAGRVMSRTQAKKVIEGQKLKRDLEFQGIFVETGNIKNLGEESSEAYKDIDEVVDVINQAGLAHKVLKLMPLGVVKG